jgi:hypothetical protein
MIDSRFNLREQLGRELGGVGTIGRFGAPQEHHQDLQ